MKNFAFILATLVALSACGGSKVKINSAENHGSDEKVLGLSVAWIKDKGKKYDFQVRLTNNADQKIIVNLTDMQCFRGKVAGELKYTFYNTGERTIDFGVGETKINNMVCRLGSEETGDFRILVKRVYSNPKGDGATKGVVIAKDIQLTLKPAS